MDWTGLVVILILLLAISLWTIAFIQLNKYGSRRGIKHFFVALLAMLVLAVLLFLFFIVPTMGCQGWYCGLESALYFLLGCLIMMICFPLILLLVNVNLFKRRANKRKARREAAKLRN